jgi:hypothetical protein
MEMLMLMWKNPHGKNEHCPENPTLQVNFARIASFLRGMPL